MIRRLLLVILVLAGIGAGIAAAYSYLMSPEYSRRLLARIDTAMPFRIASAAPPENALLPLPHILLRDVVFSFPGLPFTASAARVRIGMDFLSPIKGAPSGIDLQLDDVTLRAVRGHPSPGAMVLFLAGLTDRLGQNGDWQRIRINGLRLAGGDAGVSPLPPVAGMSVVRKGRQIDIDMDGQQNGSGFIVQITSLPLAEGRRLQAKIRLLEPGMTLTADARHVPGGPLSGRFEGELAALSRLPWLAGTLGGDLGDAEVRASGRFVLDAGSLTIVESDITAGQGKMRLKGKFPLGDDDGRGFSADLALNHMTAGTPLLRRLLALGGFAGKKAAVLSGLRGRLTLSADALTVNDGLLRAVRLRGVFVPDGLIVEELAANLPGEGRLLLSGKIRLGRFQGSLSLEADNLRALLGWLGVNTALIAPQRLRAAAIATGVDLDRDNLRLQGFTARIDGAKISGAATIGLRRRPSFALNAALDRADLDAYFPALRQGLPDALATAYCGGPLTALAVLKRFDTNTRIEADDLIVGGRRYRDARLDVTLFNGDLVLNDLTLADAAGNRIALSGKAGAEAPSLDLRGRAEITTSEGLGAALTGKGFVSAALPFVGDWGLAMKAGKPCAIDLKGRIAGGSGQASALIDDNGVRALDAAIKDVPMRRLVALQPLFALLGPAGETADMQARLEERTEAGDAAPATLTMNWPGEMRLEAKGRWANDEQRFAGRLRLETPEAGRLVRLLTGDSLPVTDKPIGAAALSGEGTVAMNALSVKDFSLLLGPLSARGSLQLTGYPRQPALSADLAFGHVPLDQVLKLPRSGLDAWRRWARSADPFVLTLPERLNARIALTAKSLEAGPWRLSDIGLTLLVDPQAMRIGQASATGYGGGVTFAAALQGGDPLILNGDLTLTGIDLARLGDVLALPYLRDDVLSGRADLALRLQGQGYAPAGLFSSLNGKSRLEADGLALASRQTVAAGDGVAGGVLRPLFLSLPAVAGNIENGIVIIPPVGIDIRRGEDSGRVVLRRGRLSLSDGRVDLLLDTDLPWHEATRLRWRIGGRVPAPEIAAVSPR